MHAAFQTLALPVALIAALGSAAAGQDPARPTAGGPPPSQAPQPAPAPVQPAEHPLSLASKLLGAGIVDTAGVPLARVTDLVIEPAGGIVVIVERRQGGLVGVPLELLQPHEPVATAEAQRAADRNARRRAPAEPPLIAALQLSVDPELLASATVIAKDAVRSLDQAALAGVRRHWAGQPPLPAESEPADPPADVPADMPADAAGRPLCVAQIRGRSVRTPAGEELGEFEDVALDLPGAKAAYVVISSGGVLGLGATSHGVPLGGLTRGADGGFVLDTDSDTLDNSPGIDLDRLPSRPSLQVTVEQSSTSGSTAHRTQR